MAEPRPAEAGSLRIHELALGDQAEVLGFLDSDALQAVIMSSFIRDNGVISPLNRGAFYACRNRAGKLQGVALFGHTTLVEARSEAALDAFAKLAQRLLLPHVIIGEQDQIEQFWSQYAPGGQSPRLMCREFLFEQRWPVRVRDAAQGLRLATLADLEYVMPVQARMAFEEGGVNPMEKDATGFRLRCARRIEQGRVWVWVEQGRLIFKADIIAETPRVVYLEGIWVNPQERGQGYGLRCLSQLGRSLLGRTGSVVVLVNEHNARAQEFYLRAGYRLRACYDTIYLAQPNC